MEFNKEQIWKSVLMNIKLEISEANFNTWFKELNLKELTDDSAIILAPNQFVMNWVKEKFSKIILKHLTISHPNIRELIFEIGKTSDVILDIPKPPQKKEQKKEKEKIDTPTLPLTRNTISKTDNLNSKYTFDSFVIGSFNELAYAAAQAIIKKETVMYNPFLIYGKTGLGKTHLMQAIGNYIKKIHPEKKVYYLTSEQFYMDVIDFIGLKSNQTTNFKRKYRSYDVLIMDDIQFLSKKNTTQMELFHLFNHLYNEGKQIILSSDKHPSQIKDLEDRLKSRFSAGMIVDIQTPDFESRVEIVKKKSKDQNHELSDDIIDYLATNIVGNIREIEGVLNNIFIQSEIKGKKLTLNEVKKIMKNSFKKKQLITPEELITIVSEFFNIDEEDIYKKTRKKEIVKPRQLIMYLLREDFSLSYPSIGEKLGGRDHTTVMHSRDKIAAELKSDSTNLKNNIDSIRSMY